MKKESNSTALVVSGVIISIAGLLFHRFNYSVVHGTNAKGMHLAPGAKPASLYAFSILVILVGLVILIAGLSKIIEQYKRKKQVESASRDDSSESKRKSILNEDKLRYFYAFFVKKPQLMFLITLFAAMPGFVAFALGHVAPLFVSVLVIALFYAAYYRGKAETEAIKNNIRVLGENTIFVAVRSKENRRMFTLLRHRDMQFNYHPATATFTAATVGGVTTGGWSVDEAHYTTSYGSKTEKYQLQFCPLDDCVLVEPILVKYIRLSENDAEAARSKQYLREFISGNNRDVLKLEHKVESRSASAASNYYQSSGDLYGAANLLHEDYTASLLTEAELLSVIRFLCGD